MAIVTKETLTLTTEDILGKDAPTESGFLEDRRHPQVSFGRCGVTGDWGKVVTLDLGDMVVEAPGYVKRDKSTGEDIEIPSEYVTYQNQLTVSRRGLQMLMDYMDNQDNPIPGITPDLKYQWTVVFNDGSGLSQYYTTEDGSEGERVFPLDRVNDIFTIRLIGRYDADLPDYAFVVPTGKFYKKQDEVDTEYEDLPIPVEDARPVYFRKNFITFGSVLGSDGLSRTINGAYVSTLYCIGWKVGHIMTNNVPANIIAIDEKGTWRAYEQTTRLEALQKLFEENIITFDEYKEHRQTVEASFIETS